MKTFYLLDLLVCVRHSGFVSQSCSVSLSPSLGIFLYLSLSIYLIFLSLVLLSASLSPSCSLTCSHSPDIFFSVSLSRSPSGPQGSKETGLAVSSLSTGRLNWALVKRYWLLRLNFLFSLLMSYMPVFANNYFEAPNGVSVLQWPGFTGILNIANYTYMYQGPKGNRPWDHRSWPLIPGSSILTLKMLDGFLGCSFLLEPPSGSKIKRTYRNTETLFQG